MKRNKLFSACAVMIIIVLVCVNASASGVTKTIKAVFNSVSVKIDGNAVSGDKILYKGNVYISSKSVANLVGKNYSVDRNGNINFNIKTSDGPASTPAPTPAPTGISYLREGMYKVGSDISAGVYYIKSSNGYGYLAVTRDSSGRLDSIIANNNFSTFTFIKVANGQYLEIKRAVFAPADQITTINPVNGKYVEGMYRIGIDLPSGEYQLIPNTSSAAYYQVASDCDGALESIITNDNFSGDKYITVQNGQYLTITRCYIKAQ